MRQIRELEAWSLPGRFFETDYSKNTLQREIWGEGVPSDLFLGISNIPDKLDTENLRLAIASGEATEQAFNEFCLLHGLSVNMNSEESSAKFLEHLNGRCLAWIHLPIDTDMAILSKLVKLLAMRGHVVIDPVTNEKITLSESQP